MAIIPRDRVTPRAAFDTSARSRSGCRAIFWWSWVVAVAVSVTGCRESGTASLSAAQEPQAQRRTAAGFSPPDTAKSFVVEFDAPDDVLRRRADGSFAVTAFQVGFFDGPALVRALEIPRSAAEIAGSRVRLRVPLITMPARSRSRIEVRVRGLSSGPLGPWSASAGSVTLPVEARAERPEQPRAAAGNAERRRSGGRERGVTVEQLNGAPALKAALAPVLGGLSEQEAAAACATLPDLATAVVLSRTHGVPLPPLCAALRERGNTALAALLSTSKPSIDAGRAIRTARAEGRALVRAAPAGGQPRATQP